MYFDGSAVKVCLGTFWPSIDAMVPDWRKALARLTACV